MTQEPVSQLVDDYWTEAEEKLGGLDAAGHERLNIANDAVDAVWDRQIFDHAETFGGPEIGFARAVSAGVLARLLEVEYVALASAGSSEVPGSGDPDLDEALALACREALDTFSNELLGPVRVGAHLVYAQPMLLESPVPFGAVILADPGELTGGQQRLLEGYLRHFDTRLNLAERLLQLRRENLDLKFEVRRLKGETTAPEPVTRVMRIPLPSELTTSMSDLTSAVPSLDIFGVLIPTEVFEEFCRNFHQVTDAYLGIFEQAPNLYLDIPSGIDAKDDHKRSAPYLRLLEIMGSLRQASRLLFNTTADDLLPYAVGGRSPSFSDLTRIAKLRAEDETIATILDIMNDQGEEAELDALSARQSPYEFRVANTGEVFGLLGLHETLKSRMPERYREGRQRILGALPKYQAARAYLFSYDRFEDVPLRGVDRTEPPDAEKLLLYREGAPAFGVVLRAFAKKRR